MADQIKTFQHGIYNCFEDCGLCALTYFCPCYVFGKNAEAVGHNCCCCGFGLLMCLGPCLGPYMRGKIRERQGIAGTCCLDMYHWYCCSFCSLVQEAREVKSFTAKAHGIERE